MVSCVTYVTAVVASVVSCVTFLRYSSSQCGIFFVTYGTAAEARLLVYHMHVYDNYVAEIGLWCCITISCLHVFQEFGDMRDSIGAQSRKHTRTVVLPRHPPHEQRNLHLSGKTPHVPFAVRNAQTSRLQGEARRSKAEQSERVYHSGDFYTVS